MNLATKPDPIDVRFGELLRMVRNAHGVSQEKLGTMNGLTFQQIQKYERGHNRVSISRLIHIANSLSVPATWFIEKLNGNTAEKQNSAIDMTLLNQREVQTLLSAYAGIENKDERQLMCNVMTIVAARNGCPNEETTENRRDK